MHDTDIHSVRDRRMNAQDAAAQAERRVQAPLKAVGGAQVGFFLHP